MWNRVEVVVVLCAMRCLRVPVFVHKFNNILHALILLSLNNHSSCEIRQWSVYLCSLCIYVVVVTRTHAKKKWAHKRDGHGSGWVEYSKWSRGHLRCDVVFLNSSRWELCYCVRKYVFIKDVACPVLLPSSPRPIATKPHWQLVSSWVDLANHMWNINSRSWS